MKSKKSTSKNSQNKSELSHSSSVGKEKTAKNEKKKGSWSKEELKA